MNIENPDIPEQPKLLADRIECADAEEKLKASLAHRYQHSAEERTISGYDLGTADHRPTHGLIYDAPLGLKF